VDVSAAVAAMIANVRISLLLLGAVMGYSTAKPGRKFPIPGSQDSYGATSVHVMSWRGTLCHQA
jgi:hypothetical protein